MKKRSLLAVAILINLATPVSGQDYVEFIGRYYDPAQANWDSSYAYDYHSGIFELNSRIVNDFDSYRRKLRSTSYSFNEGSFSWNTNTKREMQYDGFNRPIAEHHSYWSGGSFVPSTITYHTYHNTLNNDKTISLNKIKSGPLFLNDSRKVFHYNDSHRCTSYASHTYNSGTLVWESSDSTTISYNADGDPQQYIGWSNSGGTWNPVTKIVTTYDSIRRLSRLYVLSYSTVTLTWDTAGRYIFTYEGGNAKATCVEVELYDKPNATYNPSVKLAIAYADGPKPIDAVRSSYDLTTQTWIPEEETVYYYQNNAGVSKPELQLLPLVNPTPANFVHRDEQLGNGLHTMHIYDMQGKLVSSSESTEGIFKNNTPLADGLYAIVISDRNNIPVVKQKIVIQN